MAILYPWATKEYLLWNMTIGQIVMYHNIGTEIKYPKPPSDNPGSVKDMTAEEALAKRDELRKQYGAIDG